VSSAGQPESARPDLMEYGERPRTVCRGRCSTLRRMGPASARSEFSDLDEGAGVSHGGRITQAYLQGMVGLGER
jgi:hypothetical protein